MKEIKYSRTDYQKSELRKKDLHKDPIFFFLEWMKEAIQLNEDANNFVLSTVDNNAKPSSRVLLLRGISKKGFTFYTNYNSQKSKEIAYNPNVCMNFFWPTMERQVRIGGIFTKLSKNESVDYFNSRPYASRIGAHSSPQSQEIKSRKFLLQKVDYYKKKYPNDVPLPNNWGGFIVSPEYIEFWQGRSSRLHDRFLYKKKKKNNWTIIRLAP